MKISLCYLVFTFIVFHCSAQLSPHSFVTDTTYDNGNVPMIVIIPTNNIPVRRHLYDIDNLAATDILKLDVLKGKKAVDHYGKAALNGVIIFYIKQNSAPQPTKLADLKSFFSEYKIKRKDRELSLVIDSSFIYSPLPLL